MKAYSVKPRLNIPNILLLSEKGHGITTAMLYLDSEYGVKGMSKSSPSFSEGLNADNTAINSGRVAALIYQEVPVYYGVKTLEEFDVIMREELADFVVYIDAKERLTKSGKYQTDTSQKITKDASHVVVENNGTISDFHRKLDGIMAGMGVKKIIKMTRVECTDEKISLTSNSTSFVNETCQEVKELDVVKLKALRKTVLKAAKEKGVKVTRTLKDKEFNALMDEVVSPREIYLARFATLRNNWAIKMKTGIRMGCSDDMELELLGDLKNDLHKMLYRSEPLSRALEVKSALMRANERLSDEGLVAINI
ncbi:MAG: hypothetical protein CBC55_02090 [Gammaproteobacteria bacterium TMED95]|nr:MAG: hypothetical protein CBC55_02090 [Gammaproteobacteria bacterium TMED95]|tara:strand:- start:4377 stop:5303 length:927 start_codon:yes stop_codon:yes gene_type:complete